MATLSITRSQVPAEHPDAARPLGFYAPPWARYVVADHGGSVWAFERCPFVDRQLRGWVNKIGGGRFALVGTLAGGCPRWGESLHYRRGGVWVCAQDEIAAHGRRQMRDTVAGVVRFVVFMSALVAAVQAAWWSGWL